MADAETWVRVRRDAALERGEGEGPRAQVAADGQFLLGLSPDVERAEVLLDSRYLYLAGRVHVDLPPGDGVVEVPAKLGGALCGRVVAPDGEPMPPLVACSIFCPSGSGKAWRRRFTVEADGSFALTQLPPSSRYELEVTTDSYCTRSRGLSVEAGVETKLELQLHRGLTVDVLVTDDLGAPVQSALVTARPLALDLDAVAAPRRGEAGGVAGRPEGHAQVAGLSAGRWAFTVTAAQHLPCEVESEVPRRGPPLTLVMARTGAVTGLVLDVNGLPCAEAWITCKGGTSTALDPPYARSDANGHFELRDVAPGNVELFALAEGSAASARAAIDVSPAGRVGPVTLQLRGFGALEGHVEPPLADVQIVVVALDTGRRVTQETGADGTFRIERLEPGECTVEVARNDDPSATRREIAPALTVAVRDGATSQVVLELGAHAVGAGYEDPTTTATFALAGRVVDAYGVPVAEARVTLMARDPIVVHSDEAGRFELSGAPAGPHTLRYSPPSMPNDESEDGVTFEAYIPIGSELSALELRCNADHLR
ncbi:MAG: carboxypeptidase-like regulatory domain-containing protein [Planctomycetota bacterium]